MPVPLHNHSWYSHLEGVASPDALLERAHACGYSSLALTDTNNLYGAVPFVDKAVEYGIRPILGAHLVSENEECVALAVDERGWGAMCRAITAIRWWTGRP